MLNKFLPILGLLFLFLADFSQSQDRNYQTANQLFQQQQFEEALPLFRELHRQNPQSFVFFERLVDVLVHLNRLDRAEEVIQAQIERGYTPNQSKAKMGEVLHMNGKQDEAIDLWQSVLEDNSQNIQAYYTIASSMNSRREYSAAIDTYRKAQELHDNPTLFLNELANTYMQAGRFEESVNEYFSLILESPRQMAIVQQRFFQMRDDRLYDIASFELEDLLLDLSPAHEAYGPLYQLLSWLLLETEQYERAYNFARHYEEQTDYTVYSLFSLGNRFVSSGEFQFAENAFSYYTDSSNLSTRYRSYDELSDTYLQWAQYYEQNNLSSPDTVQYLFDKSYDTAEMLINEQPTYEQAGRVLTRLVDLSLDRYKDLSKAKKWFRSLQNSSDTNGAYLLYTEGRIAIFEENFSSARQLFARADRESESSNLSEKVRYFSSLSDFFAGDYEFAEIQLRSLERRNSSFYTNDAIQLRMWIQDGLRADTTGSVLKTLGDGMFNLHTGSYTKALELFEPILTSARNPFADDLTVELAALLPSEYTSLKLHLLERQINSQSHSPLLERMMWDRAVLAEQIVKNRIELTDNRSAEMRFFENPPVFEFTAGEVEELFEELVVSFPNGFYASHARKKLQQFQTDYL